MKNILLIFYIVIDYSISISLLYSVCDRKYTLLTGGSRGIGRTIAETLSREGYKTIIFLQLFYGES